jgi:hypothetical protein
LFLACGAYLCHDNYRWITQGVEAEGVVIDHHLSGRERLPVVQFTTAQGRSITFTASSGGRRERSAVKVMYMADDPQVADIKPGLGAWAFAMVFVAIGAVMCFAVIRQRMAPTPVTGIEQGDRP